MPNDNNQLGTIVGGAVGATGIFPAIRAIQDARAYNSFDPNILETGPIPSRTFKAGDIILNADESDLERRGVFKRLKQLVQNGRRDMSHATIVLPFDPKRPTEDLRLVELGALKSRRPMAKYRTLDILADSLRKGNFRKLPRAIRLNKKLQKQMLSGKTLTEKALRQILEESAPVDQIDEFEQLIRVFRAKKGLTPEELLELRMNIRKTGPTVATPTSQVFTALRSLVTPLRDKSHKLKVPGTCAGGACSAYSGIRRTMNPTTAMVTDIPLMKDFKQVLSHNGIRGVPAVLRSRALAKGAIGLKGGIAAALVSAGLGTKALIDRATRKERNPLEKLVDRVKQHWT